MAEQTNAKKLEARIVQLENALKALTALRKPVDLSADEIKDVPEGTRRNCGRRALHRELH